MNNKVGIVFPHQLFESSPLINTCKKIFLIEEWLFFKQYSFHQQKIAFHRASMKFYVSHLKESGIDVFYIESSDERSDVRRLIPCLQKQGYDEIHFVEVTDNWLNMRITSAAQKSGVKLHQHNSPLFVSSLSESSGFLSKRKILRQTDFYIEQRRRQNVLITSDGSPTGGKWTYDTENRKRYPAEQKPPEIKAAKQTKFANEAIANTKQNFSSNPGSLKNGLIYPVTFTDTLEWFNRFLVERFFDYGSYQDAIVQDETFMHHSVVSPMLNVGLITPSQMIELALDYSRTNEVPLNSLEGFIRQVLGWREFIRGVYELHGSYQRTRNFWGFTRKIPRSFWYGKTGITPVDVSIHKVLETGYCHHIERLMVLSNFMLLCEFDPDEVYRWFMEMFVDAYDWVMVPNVYGMGQFADGGLMSTKPYISGSNYLKKMADYDSGPWQEIWDALFWRFINNQRDFFGKNPRMRMLVASFDKMDSEKKKNLLNRAKKFLDELDSK